MTTFATGSTGSPSGQDALTRDALTVLQPGFTGTTAPDWLLRRLGEGLASVGLFGRNITSPEQLSALTAQLRAEHEDVLVAIDEEAPPSPATTPWAPSTTSTSPGTWPSPSAAASPNAASTSTGPPPPT
jgi:hypothetical protein